MQTGFNLPISGPLSDPDTVIRIAREGEALGYDYLTLTDHILPPNLKAPGTKLARYRPRGLRQPTPYCLNQASILAQPALAAPGL